MRCQRKRISKFFSGRTLTVAETTSDTWRPGSALYLSIAEYPPNPAPIDQRPEPKLGSAQTSAMKPLRRINCASPSFRNPTEARSSFQICLRYSNSSAGDVCEEKLFTTVFQ